MATPAENYTITNCTMLSGHGGVVIGSEMSGGIKKITISNCVFDGTDRGIRIKTARGRGGVVEDIRVDNIIMKNIRDEAIVLNMFYQKSEPEPISERTPQFKNIHFSNITAHTEHAVRIIGIEEMPVENVTFQDIQFNAVTGIEINNAKNIEFHNVGVSTTSGPALITHHVNRLEVDGLYSPTPLKDTPVIQLNNTQEIFMHSCFPIKGTDTFIELNGPETSGVTIKGNNFLNVKIPVKKGNEVSEIIETE